MISKSNLFFRFLLLPFDCIIIIFSFFLAYSFRSNQILGLVDPNLISVLQFIPFVVLFAILFQIILFFLGGYNLHNGSTFISDSKKIVFASIIWLTIIVFFFFWTRNYFFSRFILLLGCLFSSIFIIFLRGIFAVLRRYFLKKENMFIVGGESDTKNISHLFSKLKFYNIDSGLNWKKSEDTDVLVLINKNITQKEREYIDFCIIHHIRVFIYTPNLLRNKTEITVGGVQLHEIFDTPLYGWQRVFKRLFDILFSVFALILLSPVMIVISLIIKKTSEGPIIVGLTRVCRGNKTFQLYKFRSMVNNAADMKKDLMKHNERGDGPLFKMKEDPRITPVGKFIRKTRIDEIPQFYNVLLGDMSVVGPRPHEPNEVSKYTEEQKRLLMIKPGITGMAQTSGASDLTFEEEVLFDMNYVQNWNIWIDIWLVIKTIWVVIKKKGAA